MRCHPPLHASGDAAHGSRRKPSPHFFSLPARGFPPRPLMAGPPLPAEQRAPAPTAAARLLAFFAAPPASVVLCCC